GVQIHGGMGFIDDAEISQVYRDARIGPIFEGTNYIQAQDLLGRKVMRDRGDTLRALLGDIETAARELPQDPSQPLHRLRVGLIQGCSALRAASDRLVAAAANEPELIGAVAWHFLQWLGVLAGAWQHALSARSALATRGDAELARAMLDCAVFYSAHVLPRIHTHEAAVTAGAGPVTAADPACL
ncbi:MAG TPA: acyl-CoA dehydrogenase C-terminal domain-containing protein, partial [Steroidobacteraceae bacterium]|nr:acyl-CoA dehydrogenase C-terminal domain-containing protein [Steroidobacteraceae bacterium]